MTTNEKVDDFLEHYGKKGMKWGTRRTRRIQNRIDRVHRVAEGSTSKKDIARNILTGAPVTRKGSARALRRGAALQKQVKDGDAFVANLLLKVEGIRIKDLNYHQDK